MILSSLWMNTVQAAKIRTTVRSNCDIALGKCVEVVEKQKAAIDSQQKTIKAQNKLNSELEAQNKEIKSASKKAVTGLSVLNIILLILLL